MSDAKIPEHFQELDSVHSKSMRALSFENNQSSTPLIFRDKFDDLNVKMV